MNTKNSLIFAVYCVLILCFAGQAAAVPVEKFPKLQSFIKYMVKGHRFDHERLTEIFRQAKIRSKIIEKMNRPYESKPWYVYRSIFVTPKRVREGVAFWRRYEKTLRIAEREYGVPASIIVAIIGVETDYGKHPYEFRVIDALTTLAFKYPRRAKFFRAELEQYLLLARDHKFDPLDLLGSYAGAIGLPQFMPSSYRKYAINMAGPRVDLLNSGDDAIGSVANYLMSYGWKKGEVVAMRARVQGKHPPLAKRKNYKPKLSLRYFRRHGVRPVCPVSDVRRAVLIRLQDRKGHEYWLGFNNFYVITRYNSSDQYALAAYELSREIAGYRHRLALIRHRRQWAKRRCERRKMTLACHGRQHHAGQHKKAI